MKYGESHQFEGHANVFNISPSKGDELGEDYPMCDLCNEEPSDVGCVIETDEPYYYCYRCVGILKKLADG